VTSARKTALYVRNIDFQPLPVEGHVLVNGRGLAIFKLGPAILHPENLSSQDSVIVSVLGAFALLAVLGIHYPLKMLPLLLRVRVEVHLGLGSRAAPIAFRSAGSERKLRGDRNAN